MAEEILRDDANDTGLPGLFDLMIDLSASAEEGGGKEMAPAVRAKIVLGRSLLAVVEEQLGMKVEGRKLPAELLVIDHAERVPTEN